MCEIMVKGYGEGVVGRIFGDEFGKLSLIFGIYITEGEILVIVKVFKFI